MNDRNKAEDREAVLFAFHQECARPTAGQIIAWVSRFPQFADDIRAHAAVAWDWAMREGLADEELDESISARGYSQALNIIFNEEHSAENLTASCQRFQDMLAAAGTDIPRLARELDVGRSVLADLVNGWMLTPVPERFVDAVVPALAITRESFYSALQLALESPYLGHAKADKTPTIKPRSADQIIRESDMSEERKRYWLGED
jgi:hypothetical protein